MSALLDIFHHRYFLWSVLGLPFVYLAYAYQQEQLFYGEVIHSTGELSVRAFMLALIATPLVMMFPGKAFPRWLKKSRRYFGISSFAYAALHTVVYLGKVDLWPDIVKEALMAEYWTGWIALAIFFVLAVTSNDSSVRLLKRAWKKLHRIAYLAGVLLFTHWVLVAFDRGPAIAHLLVLAGFEGYRIWREKFEGQYT